MIFLTANGQFVYLRNTNHDLMHATRLSYFLPHIIACCFAQIFIDGLLFFIFVLFVLMKNVFLDLLTSIVIFFIMIHIISIVLL